MARRGRPVEIPEEKLLDAARELLLRKGLRATTAEIAARAGVSEGLVFYRYRTKEALLVAVLEREQTPPDRLAQLVAAAGAGQLPAALAEVGGAVLANIRATAPFIDLVRASPSYPRVKRLMARARISPERLQQVVARWLAAEQAAGRLRALDPLFLSRVIFGAALDHELGRRVRELPVDPAADAAFLRALADLLLRGALPPAGRRAAARNP